jgi:hypothetical protein
MQLLTRRLSKNYLSFASSRRLRDDAGTVIQRLILVH